MPLYRTAARALSARRSRSSPRLHPGREDGQIAFTFVITLLAVFVLLGFSLDAGLWFFDHRTAQNQADATALAIVQELPQTQSEISGGVMELAEDWLERNNVVYETLTTRFISGANVSAECANGPMAAGEVRIVFGRGGGAGVAADEYDRVRVCVRRNSIALMSGLAGIQAVTVGAAATAGVIVEDVPEQFAFYANCQSSFATGQNFCIKMSGSGNSGNRIDITGRTHTNRRIEVSGSHHRFNGPVTYGLTGNVFHSSTAYNSGAPPCANPNLHCLAPDMPVPMPQPVTWSEFRSGSAWLTPPCTQTFTSNRTYESQTLSGVICVSGNIEIKDNVRAGAGGVTFVASGEIKISGGGIRLTPAYKNVILFSNRPASAGAFAIDMSGQGNRYDGVILAPLSGVKFSGSDHTGNDGGAIPASIIADHIDMSGSNWDLLGVASSSSGGGDKSFWLVD